MKLTWLGTAALLLESGGYTLAIDPFPGMPYDKTKAVPPEPFRRADAVLATHGHFDHIQAIPELYGDLPTPIYATKTPCETLASRGISKDRLHRFEPGQTFTLGPFTISACQGRHCHFDAPLVTRTLLRFLLHPKRAARIVRVHRAHPEAGETQFFQITDGTCRLQVMGSLGMDPDTAYPTGADWLVLPFQGRSDLAVTAMPFVERLKPRQILLDHYDDAFPPMSSQIPTGDFCRDVEERLGIPARALIKYETLSL